MTSPTATSTVTAPKRIAALDVLRGIAILGTLGTNVWIFTDPEGFFGYLDRAMRQPDSAGMWAERILQQLAQGKFLGLLTIMFGIGLAIQQASAARAGRRWPGPYLWRAGLLFVDGIINYLLIAEFDVLMGYAITAFIVAFILITSERSQRIWLWIMVAIHLAFIALMTASLYAVAGEAWGTAEPLVPNPYADGSFADLVVLRIENLGFFRAEIFYVFALSIALFLVGARLLRAGVFTPEGHRLRRRLLVVGAVAAVVDLGVGLAVGGNALFVTRYGTAPLVALGILALVAQFYLRRQVGLVGRRLGEVGRTALTSYMLQNLLAGVICYGWGLGLAARFAPEHRVLFTVCVYLVVSALVLGFAHVWLRRFDRGPVEWVWNLAYRRLAN